MNGPRVLNGELDLSAISEFLDMEKPSPTVEDSSPQGDPFSQSGGFADLSNPQTQQALKEAQEFSVRNNHVHIRHLWEFVRLQAQHIKDLNKRVQKVESRTGNQNGMRV